MQKCDFSQPLPKLLLYIQTAMIDQSLDGQLDELPDLEGLQQLAIDGWSTAVSGGWSAHREIIALLAQDGVKEGLANFHAALAEMDRQGTLDMELAGEWELMDVVQEGERLRQDRGDNQAPESDESDLEMSP